MVIRSNNFMVERKSNPEPETIINKTLPLTLFYHTLYLFKFIKSDKIKKYFIQENCI